jgi:hypothetical protein
MYNFVVSFFKGSDGVHEAPAGPTQAAQRGHRVYPGQLLPIFFSQKINNFLRYGLSSTGNEYNRTAENCAVHPSF